MEHNTLTKWEVVEDISACLADATAGTIAKITATLDCDPETKRAGNLHKMLHRSSMAAVEQAFNAMAKAMNLPMSISMQKAGILSAYVLTYHIPK